MAAASIIATYCGLALGQPGPSTVIANLAGRETVSLDGTWNAIVDPYEAGLSGRLYENRKPHSKSDLVEYDFDAAGTLKVPGDWNSQRDSLLFYEGPIWYQRYFTFHPAPGRRVFLYFGAANYQARVWLNGQKLGEHVGGFTPFNFEATSRLADGENSVVVEVNNSRPADGVPAPSTDWWNYGGLTRSVELVEVPGTFIQNYFVQLAKGRSDEIAGWVQLNGVDRSEAVTVAIPQAGVTKTVTADSSGLAQFQLSAKLTLWSPDNPKLYDVVVSAGTDRTEEKIGFRSIEVRGARILLNGKPIFLRGISMHDEAPFRGGRAFSEADSQTLLGWAKELGCNFIRLAHYPHNENTVRLADRMGLLLWSEVPVYWDIAWDNPGTLENAEEQLRDSIARDHNRAAIILWSLFNETPPKPDRVEFIRRLAAYARQLDDTRLLTSAMNRTVSPSPNVRVLNDPLGQYLDVLGLNEYVGWYDGAPQDIDRIEWKTTYDKPLIVSEFGAGAVYGRRGDDETRFSEEYQAAVFKHQIEALQKIPSLAGMTPWVLMDFRSPRRWLAGTQDFYNRKGVISDRGQRKQAFYALQKFYEQMAKKQK
jgi:beta-glucuronidase